MDCCLEARMGDERVTNEPMEGHYIGFNMWLNAVEAAGSSEVDAVRAKLYCQTFPNLTVEWWKCCPTIICQSRY